MKQGVILSVTSMLALGACVSESTLYSAKATGEIGFNKAKPSGPIYYLPYTVLEIEAGYGVAAAKAPASKSTKASAKADAAGTSINVEVTPTLTSTVTTAPVKPGAKPTPQPSPKKYGVKITAHTLPDYKAAYRAGFSLARVSSDAPNLQISDTGLLNSVSAVSKDETRETLVKFAESAGTIAGLLAGAGTGGAKFRTFSLAPPTLPPTDTCPGGQTKREKPSIKQFCAVTALGEANFCAGSTVVTAKIEPDIDDTTRPTLDVVALETDPDTYGGLLYRSRVRVPVMVEIEDNCGDTVSKTIDLYSIIDPQSTNIVSAIRRPFVKSETTLTFKDGVLTALKGDYPSTGGAILSTPADLISGVFTGLGNALSFQATNINSEAELIKAQTALIEAQTALEAARSAAVSDDGE